MRVKYLGTGASEGMPALFCACPVCLRSMQEGGKSLRKRSCTQIDESILIDLSPDIFAQKLQYGLRLDRLEAIVFTHSHPDHQDAFALELCGKASCSIHPSKVGQKDELRLYGNDRVKARFECVCQTERVLAERFVFTQIEHFKPFSVGKYTFHPLRANHRPIETEDCVIYALEDDQTQILYANDTGRIAEENLEYIKEKDLHFSLVSMDCARGVLPGDGHMGIKECIELRDRLKTIGAVDEQTRFVLNHLSHMNDMTHGEWEAYANPLGFEVAYDGLEIQCG